MKEFIKGNKVLLIILLISVIVSVQTAVGRMSVEAENDRYDTVLDYKELESMANQSEYDIKRWLSEFKRMGINKVGLSEESIYSLMEDSKIPVTAQTIYEVKKKSLWEHEIPQELMKKMKEMKYNEFDVLVRVGSRDTYTFIDKAMSERYDHKKFFAVPTDQGGVIFVKGSAGEALYSQKDKIMDSKHKGFREKNEIVGSKVMYLNLGLMDSKRKILEDAGMQIIPRTSSYDGWNDKRYAEAVLKEYRELKIEPEYVIIGGEGIPGYDDGIDTMKNYVKETKIRIGLIETTTQRGNIMQKGVTDVVENSNYNAVRVFSVWDYIQNRYKYYGYSGAQEIENTFFRAITERNIRVLYFKPIRQTDDYGIYVTEPEEYHQLFKNLNERLAAHNIEVGKATVLENYKVSQIKKFIIFLGSIAAGVILLSTLFRLKQKHKIVLLVIGTMLTASGFLFAPSKVDLVTSFVPAVLIPCIALSLLIRESKVLREKKITYWRTVLSGEIMLIILVVISLLGGFMTCAPISSINYMLEINIFRGVKLAQLLPLCYFVPAYLATFGFGKGRENKRSNTLEIRDIRAVLNLDIKVWMVLLIMIVGGIGIYYIMRTGHESSAQVSSLEMLFRNTLEDHLLARPRTKEFLFAFPMLVLFVYAVRNDMKLISFIFGLGATIGLTSVVNTFMHIRTPLFLGLARTGYSLIFGIILSIIAVCIFKGLHVCAKKIKEEIHV